MKESPSLRPPDGYQFHSQLFENMSRQVEEMGLWRQILADLLEVELVTVNTTEGAAYGAALLAGVGAGAWQDVPSACRAAIQITGETKPQGISYERFYHTYRQLYPALQDLFPMLNE